MNAYGIIIIINKGPHGFGEIEQEKKKLRKKKVY
jgi:hypothetical protein